MPCGFESHLSHQKREGTFGTLSFLVCERDSKNEIQQSSGLLLAGKGPGDTFIFASGKNANESHLSH